MERCTTRNGGINSSDPRCKCEIGAAGFGINPERMDRADFVADFATDNYRVITHIDNTATTTGDAFFLTSFGLGVWMAILSLVLLFTFLKLLDRRFAPPDESYTPLPRSECRFKRNKHFLLKSKVFFRLRKAAESTGTSEAVIVYPKI